jgi:hypothetical protein
MPRVAWFPDMEIGIGEGLINRKMSGIHTPGAIAPTHQPRSDNSPCQGQSNGIQNLPESCGPWFAQPDTISVSETGHATVPSPLGWLGPTVPDQKRGDVQRAITAITNKMSRITRRLRF